MQAEIITLSDLEQNKVWEGWLSAEVRGCYFAELVTYYQRRHHAVRLGTLLFSSGTSILIVAHWTSDWPKLILALITTALTLAFCSSD
jgi:hypothetical protein